MRNRGLDYTALTLVIIGAINWGLRIFNTSIKCKSPSNPHKRVIFLLKNSKIRNIYMY